MWREQKQKQRNKEENGKNSRKTTTSLGKLERGKLMNQRNVFLPHKTTHELRGCIERKK
jgi:hypothetical protein